MQNENRDVLLVLLLARHGAFCCRFRYGKRKSKHRIAREYLAFELHQRRHVLSVSVPNFLHSYLMLKHIREKDSCSQISPLKKYIKRMNHRAQPRMTQVTGRRTEQNLGMEACASMCERRCRKGLPSLSSHRLYFWLYASPRVQNSICGVCVGLDEFVWKCDRKTEQQESSGRRKSWSYPCLPHHQRQHSWCLYSLVVFLYPSL